MTTKRSKRVTPQPAVARSNSPTLPTAPDYEVTMRATITIVCSALLVHSVAPFDLLHVNNEDERPEDSTRGRRDVIEEEKFYNMRSDRNSMNQVPWLPGPVDDDPTTKISLTKEPDVADMYQTTEKVTEKPTGRGARASNENWIKLPYLNRDDKRDILTPPQPSGDLINSRMPRVNFVTQNKVLEASESRNDKESLQRPTRTDDLRTEFVRPEEDRPQYRPVYPRQAVYHPEDSRPYYDDRYYAADDLYKRDPYYDLYDRSRYNPYSPRVDRYDEGYNNYVPRKPKRIIYYAHLPDVIRTPPSVDLRYRYTMDPYRRLDEDYYTRVGRYDYRFRNRYPYAPVRKDERRFGYRDLVGASTAAKDKKLEEKVTPTPVLPQKDDKFKTNVNVRNNNRNNINSHQYHDDGETYNSKKNFQDQTRRPEGYLRFDEPLFHTVDDPYQRKY
ncbi:hypothetical protein KGM_205404 [Danaus plexippus plexippus]|uniref:Uncharacterized protein n=1 Tax=Danaus plexippus plexippus TaxID=278856 RepID=A0A212F3Q9_DANPL|nr:hypothetical protein KGM_205404 [Danaus plexippus plexippus]